MTHVSRERYYDMDLRPVTFWNYFSVQSGTYKNSGQFTKVTIRALTPTRRKLVDRSSIVFGVIFAALLVIGVFPPVMDGINHPMALLIIPLFGGGFYILATALLILFLRKEKVIIIDEHFVKIQWRIFFWSTYDRTKPLAFTEKSYSPLSNKKLEEELINEKLQQQGVKKKYKAYYTYSKQVIIEHEGIPSLVFPIHGVVLAGQVRCRLQAILNDIPIGGAKKIAATPEEVWRNQAGDLTHK